MRPAASAAQYGRSTVRYSTSDELFLASKIIDAAPYIKLTMAEWQQLGTPAPELLTVGYAALSWLTGIVVQVDSARPESAVFVSGEQLAAAGWPTPELRPMLPGDRVCTLPDGRLGYDGVVYRGPLTIAEWEASGKLPPDGPC